MQKRATADTGAQIMTVDEVAGYLRVSAATIYKLAQARTIPASKIGRIWRFSRQQVEDWVRQQAEVPGPAVPGPTE